VVSNPTRGPVKHIVVGSAAIEHKIYSGPFSKKFPSADVWLPPKNWSFPVDLPLEAYVPYYPKVGRLYKLNAVDPQLESARFQRLSAMK
jgi:hypothetical protein